MRALRIRWQGVAKVAGAAVCVVVAIAALPGLLRAPEPPPLGKDVGLPRVGAFRTHAVQKAPTPKRRRGKRRSDGAFLSHSEKKAPKRRWHRDKRALREPERARSKAPRAHEPAANPAPAREPALAAPPAPPVPAPESVSPPSPEPAPPSHSPAPVEDGSAEFAPH